MNAIKRFLSRKMGHETDQKEVQITKALLLKKGVIIY
jgi:hypothetical protein